MRNPNSYGSCYKMSGKRRKPWRVRVTIGWTEDGKQIYLNIGTFATKKEGLMALAAYHNNPYDIEKTITFEEVFNRWFEEKEKHSTTKNMNLYKLSYSYCQPLYKKPMVDIKKTHIQNLFDNLDKSYAMKSKIKTLLNQLFNWSIENDIIDKNYVKFVTIPKDEEKKEQIIFNKEQIEYLFSIADKDTTAKQVLILIYTGMRINEFLSLETSNLKDGYIIGGSKTEAGRDRPIVFHDKILPFVKEFYNPANTTLIVNQLNKPIQYRTYYNKWYKKLEEWGFPTTNIHSTRHTFISMAKESGVDDLVIKRQVGHSNGNDITHHYTHLTVEYMKKEINKIT